MDKASLQRFVGETWSETIVPTLCDYIRIPNRSPVFDADWAKHGYMDEAAALIERWCARRPIGGLTVELVRLLGRTPLLYMEIPAAAPSHDTVLLYGHLDKQPEFTGWTGQRVNRLLQCEWVDIDNPDPNLAAGEPTCFRQGRDQGGAAFNRLEGIYRGEGGSVYFVSTSGGEARYGQLWQYRSAGPDKGNLRLVFESPDGSVLDSPDNLCVTPSGSILFCEDDASGADNDTHPLAPGFRNIDRLIGLTRDGLPFEFAVNIHNESEFAGACFSPDGNILFVNIFGGSAPGSGMTCAITGPWRRGPL